MHGDTVAYGAGDGTTGLWNPTADPDHLVGSFNVCARFIHCADLV
jgi:hypothetical protein